MEHRSLARLLSTTHPIHTHVHSHTYTHVHSHHLHTRAFTPSTHTCIYANLHVPSHTPTRAFTHPHTHTQVADPTACYTSSRMDPSASEPTTMDVSSSSSSTSSGADGSQAPSPVDERFAFVEDEYVFAYHSDKLYAAKVTHCHSV
jgi:hypothetical protein